jgi:hypothetical protein
VSIYVPGPYCTVRGALPPASLGDLPGLSHGQDGYADRILLAYPDPVPSRWNDEEVPEAIEDGYGRFEEALYSLVGGAGGPEVLTLAPEAWDLLAGYVNAVGAEAADDNLHPLLRGVLAKLEGYAARFALIVYVGRTAARETHSEQVDAESVRKAMALAQYFRAHAQRIYSVGVAGGNWQLERDARAVQEWILRSEAVRGGDPSSFRYSDLRHGLHNRFGHRDEDLLRVLRLLECRGYLYETVTPRHGPTGRNPKPTYLVNPLWLGASGA